MKSRIIVLCLGAGLAAGAVWGQTPAPKPGADTPPKVDRAAAYYNYSLAHLYEELAEAPGTQREYVNRAVEHYRAAIKADPTAGFLSEQLSDLYIRSGQIKSAVLEAEEALRQNPDDLNARRVLGRIYSRMIGDSQQNRINEEMLKKALEQYQKISEKEPKNADIWLMLGRLYKISQNSVESEKAYKKVLELEPDNEDAMTGLAMVYMDLGDQKSASDMLRRVAEKAPSLRSLTALAGTYEQMREYSLAAETLRRALEMAPNNPEMKRAYAQNLLFAEQLDAALKVYQELVDEDAKDAQSHLRMSQIYRQQSKYDLAREASRKARELDPSSIEIRYNEVNLLEAEGKLPEATTLLKEILATTSKKSYSASERGNRVVLLERLGLMHRNQDHIKDAVETFRQIVALDPELGSRASAQIIETYRGGKDYVRADEEASAAIKKYPNDRTLLVVRSNLLADMGKTDQAAAELTKLLDGKNDRETYLSLAQIYDKAKNYVEMSKALDAAEKLSDSKEEKEGVAFMRGGMLEKMKKFDEAEAEFRKVLAFNPENASALNYLGYMFADRNVKLTEALQLITKALDHDPQNGAYLDSLGWVYYRLGRLPEAETQLRRALQRVSKDPTIHDHLGDVYFQQGKLKEAIAHWQNSVNEWKNSAPSDIDATEVAKIQKKLEGARVRLAKEGSATPEKQR